MMTITIT